MTDIKKCKIAIAGLGVVGGGVVELIQRRHRKIMDEHQLDISIVGVSARTRKRNNIAVEDYPWFDDAADMVKNSDADIVAEVIGGTDGIAPKVWQNAIENNCHIVTANKALLAMDGLQMATNAERNGVMILYEAAVAGGIPVINCLTHAMAGNNIAAIQGILNGTCNYILSQMLTTGQGFDQALVDAQEKGFAEADPHFDVDGIDASHKLAILAALAFGEQPDFQGITIQGIRTISPMDIRYACEMGYVLKLIGTARLQQDGAIAKTVMPAMVSNDDMLAHVKGVQNAVAVHTDALGSIMLEGPGAGSYATASAIVSDIVNCANAAHANKALPVFMRKADNLTPPKKCDESILNNQFYLRMNVDDTPGVVAAITSMLAEHQISIANVTQHTRNADAPVSLVIITHSCSHKQMRIVCQEISKLHTVKEPPCTIVIEDSANNSNLVNGSIHGAA